MRPKYGMYEKLMKNLRESDGQFFKNIIRAGPELFNKMVEDLGPKFQKREKKLQETSVHWIETCHNAQVTCHRGLVHDAVILVRVGPQHRCHSCARDMSSHI